MTNRIQITDEDIQALVDNELPRDDAEKVMTYIRHSPELHARYEELVDQKELLQRWWSNSPQEN